MKNGHGGGRCRAPILMPMKISALWHTVLFLAAGFCSIAPLVAQAPAPQAEDILKHLPAPILLWPNGAPGALGTAEADKPRLYPFVPQEKSTTAAVLVIPGGGYAHVAIGHEGIQFARWLNAQGVTAFVLDYRVGPYRYPVEIEDGMRAMRYVRVHAAEYGIDPNRLGVWGSSAGGHLASTLGTHCDELDPALAPASDDPVDHASCKPAFMVLAYPVISMQLPQTHAGSRQNLLGDNPDPQLEQKFSNQLAVNAQTPPTFIFATIGDKTVPVVNSLDFFRALEAAHVPAELHVYDYANHGCGLCASIPELSTWPLLLRSWLIHGGWLPKTAPPLPPAEQNYPGWPAGLDGPGKS
jgi:acetyl esterase/lipase